MSAAPLALDQSQPQERAPRPLHSLYVEMARRFCLDDVFGQAQNPLESPDPEVVNCAIDKLDTFLHSFHLRQLLSDPQFGTEQNLRALARHYLEKTQPDAADRDKIDFLLAQYFSCCAPPEYAQGKFTLEQVAQALEPVLGETPTDPPAWTCQLDQLLGEFSRCQTLEDAVAASILERARKIKQDAGPMYYGSSALLAVVRYNFLARRHFFRVLRHSLEDLWGAIERLHQRGVASIDATSAGLGAAEPLHEIQRICQDWRHPLRSAYATPHAFTQLLEIHKIVKAAAKAKDSPSIPPATSAAPAAKQAQVRPPEKPVQVPPPPAAPVSTKRPAAASPAPVKSQAQAQVPTPVQVPPPPPAAPVSAKKSPEPLPSAAAKEKDSRSNQPVNSVAPAAQKAQVQKSVQVPPPPPAVPVSAKKPAAASPMAARPQAQAQKPMQAPPPAPAAPVSAKKPAAVSPMAARPQAQVQKPMQVPPPPPAAPVSAKKPAAASPEPVPSLEGAMEAIAAQLLGVKPSSTVTFCGTKFMLSSWEVAAFVKGGDEMADALQHAVSVAALVNVAASRARTGQGAYGDSAISLAEDEITLLELLSGRAREAQNLDGAFNLAGTAKRLRAFCAELQKAAKRVQ